jgi:hypothetical protein
MLEPCEHQSSFSIYGVVVGRCDWGDGGRIRSHLVALEVAPGTVTECGRSSRQSQCGEFAGAAQAMIAAATRPEETTICAALLAACGLHS